MLWKITRLDQAFIAAFADAGEPDQVVINTYLAQTRRRQQPPKYAGVKRWYYLLNGNGRVRLATIGRPLEDFESLGAKIVVGTHEIIGEFFGNQEFIGKRGLKLQCEPVEWLSGQPDREFATGSEALAEISEQILDLRCAERNIGGIRRNWEWRKS